MKVRVKKITIFGLLFICSLYALCFSLGQYWDHFWPYFLSDYHHLLNTYQYAWIDQNLGAPIGYLSQHYFVALVSLISYLPIKSELLEALVYSVALFTISFFCYKNLNKDKKANHWLLLSLSVFVVLNPAIFYKLMAGHLYYLIALSISMAFYFILFQKKSEPAKAVMLGLLFGLALIQIQFAVFNTVLLAIYLVFDQQKYKKKLLQVFWTIVIAFFVNLPWLANYLTGVSSVGSASVVAAGAAFTSSARANLLNIITMAFSQATVIEFVYQKWELIFFGLFSVLVFVYLGLYLFKYRKGHRIDNIVLAQAIALLIYIFLGTGVFAHWHLPVVSVLYPMLREVGHLAPLIIIFEVFLLGRLIYLLPPSRGFLIVLYAYLFCFIIINAFNFINYLPRINYDTTRNSLSPYKSFYGSIKGSSRVATYPFWNQYSLNSSPIRQGKDSRAISNNGFDNLTNFSGIEYLSNYTAGGQAINNTWQYRLEKTLDITELENMGVKYLIDLSPVFESNFEQYTEAVFYDYDKSIIKTDSNFFEKLKKANPDKLIEIAPHIYQLQNPRDRIYLLNQSAEIVFTKINPTSYQVLLGGVSDKSTLVFNENFHPDWKLFLSDTRKNSLSCNEKIVSGLTTECLDDTFRIKKDYLLQSSQSHQNQNSWTISLSDIQSIYPDLLEKNPDGTYNISLVIYFWPQHYYSMALLVSLVTSMSLLAYLIFYHVKSWKQFKEKL